MNIKCNHSWQSPSEILRRSSSFRQTGQIESRVLRDLDGLQHGSQQTLSPLTPQSRAKALRTSDQQLYHNIGILLYTLTFKKTTANI